MGFRGLSIGSLIIIFLILILFFGAKRLKEIGNDLGIAIRQFRKGIQDDQEESK